MNRDETVLNKEFVRRLNLAMGRYARLYPGEDQPFITEGYRSPERQAELYAQGRTKPGKIVTNTRESLHQYGYAADIAFRDSLYAKPEKFIAFARLAEDVGLLAGAFWQDFPDLPHIQADITITDARLGKSPRYGRIHPLDLAHTGLTRVYVDDVELDVDVINQVGTKLFVVTTR